MTTTEPHRIGSAPSIEAAEKAIVNGERILWHARTEATNDTPSLDRSRRGR